MITLKDLIQETEFEKVWEIFDKHYEIGSKRTKETYANFYKKLITLSSDCNKNNMVIYIKVLKEDANNNLYFPDNFDENDIDVYYDVCGQDSTWDCYALGGISFEEWLGYDIDPVTLSKLTYPSIIAHCLEEMTFYGFDT